MQYSSGAIEEIEEQESSKKSKPREKYISLENAVMRRIIDSRKIKAKQKKKLASNNDEPVLNSEKIQKNIEENIPAAIKEKVQPEIPATIINQVKKIKEALISGNDVQIERSAPIQAPVPTPIKKENNKGARHAYKEGLHSKADGIASHAEGLLTHATGPFSHAEGTKTKATGHSSHSEGSETTAGGSYSHAEGKHAIALGEAYMQKEPQLSLTDSHLMRKEIIHQQLILQAAILWGNLVQQKKLIPGLSQMGQMTLIII